MKTPLIIMVAGAVCLAAWQRHRIIDLRGMEQTLARESAARKAEAGSPEDAGTKQTSAEQAAEGLSEEEFADFTAKMVSHRPDFETKRFTKLANLSAGNWIAVPSLCEPLRRLSSRQLLAVLESWSGGEKIERGFGNATGNFVMMVESVNPAALTQLYYELRRDHQESLLNGNPGFSIWRWFQQDPEGFERWARAAGPLVSGDKTCAVWLQAAEVLRTPSVEHLRRLLAEKSWDADTALGIVAQQLTTDELRVQFFQSLHAATNGNVENVGQHLSRMAANTPFPKLAAMADAVPSFATPPFKKTNPHSSERPMGNLRYEVAIWSRDFTAAERWQWLITRPADRPTGDLLARLVDAWCDHDFPDTSRWVQSLPAGAERLTARKAVIEFLKWNGAHELAAEWEGQQ